MKQAIDLLSFESHSPEETEKIGRLLCKHLPKKVILTLSGQLGAGKTTLVKGIISGSTHTPPNQIESPTFSYLHPYETPYQVAYHFDLYRMSKIEDFFAKGFDEYFDKEAICCIEWAEKLAPFLPAHYHISIDYLSFSSRSIQLRGIDGKKNSL